MGLVERKRVLLEGLASGPGNGGGRHTRLLRAWATLASGADPEGASHAIATYEEELPEAPGGLFNMVSNVLLWVLGAYGDRVSEQARQRVVDYVRLYWAEMWSQRRCIDVPFDPWDYERPHCRTENHYLNEIVCRMLTAELLAGETYPDGRPAEEHAEYWRRGFFAFCAERARKGFREWDSLYLQLDLFAALAAAELASDAKVRHAASVFADLCVLILARTHLTGCWAGPHARVYFKEGLAWEHSPVYLLGWVLFGSSDDVEARRWAGEHPSWGALAVAASRYEPPESAVALARSRPPAGGYTTYARPGPAFYPAGWPEATPPHRCENVYVSHCDREGTARPALSATFLAPHFALGCVIDVPHLSGEFHSHCLLGALTVPGMAEPALFPLLGTPEQSADTHGGHGTWGTHSARWEATTLLEANVMLVQLRGTYRKVRVRLDPRAQAEFEDGFEGEPEVMHPRLFVAREFRCEEEEGWVFLEGGEVFAAVRPVRGGYSWDRGHPRKYRRGEVLVCEVPDDILIIEAAERSWYGGEFSAFQQDILNRGLSSDGQWLRYCTRESRVIRFCGQEVGCPTVDGCEPPRNPPLFDGPFIKSAYDSGRITLEFVGHTLTLDFTDPSHPKRETKGDFTECV